MKSVFQKPVLILWILLGGLLNRSNGQAIVSPEKMQEIYEQVKTPFKYGWVLAPPDDSKKCDSPTVFRFRGKWYMTYIVYDGKTSRDGRGYETWLAQSKDLLHWNTLGKILSFANNGGWDCNQKAGYLALVDPDWKGSQKAEKYRDRYWLSYIGGGSRGYETPPINIGMACSEQPVNKVVPWETLSAPVLKADDRDSRWWDNEVLYKSTVIHDKQLTLGHPFVMFYNAKGGKSDTSRTAERIGMAVSDDLLHWQRYGTSPVLDHHQGITGDAQIRKMGPLWVMFYFGAFWKDKPGAFDRFACSYDLVHWTDWQGEDLIAPSEPFDNLYAHKPWVVRYKGIVYHFYCAVNKQDQRGIAVATSKNLRARTVHFVEKIPDKK
ncbi:MAG: hypothetical protein LWW85_00080 [Marinilabiliales bacterium]|nr:hypothetical protein [Marinilabiliales bacterium]